MSKCCSGSIQEEYALKGSFKNAIKHNQDSCVVLKLAANEVVYIMSEDRVEDNNINNNTQTSCISPVNRNLVIAIVIMSLFILGLFVGIIYLVRKKR